MGMKLSLYTHTSFPSIFYRETHSECVCVCVCVCVCILHMYSYAWTFVAVNIMC